MGWHNPEEIEGLWAADPRVTDDWADGYRGAQMSWTGWRPEDYHPDADEAADVGGRDGQV